MIGEKTVKSGDFDPGHGTMRANGRKLRLPRPAKRRTGDFDAHSFG
ncbi:hypothetical protein [Pseudomonas sp. 2848]|nr:hypothetical protein [Pseudomonas sp. 2848]